jgi:hypothetical protein
MERFPMLEALLAGKKLWNSGAPALVQKAAMRKVQVQITAEFHSLSCDEPEDEFNSCILLGALNLIEGLLSEEKFIEQK